jgi:hypothetical protein
MSEIINLVQKFWWEKYNTKDSFLPFYIPFVIWSSSYIYCRIIGREFHRWYTLHNFHNIVAICIGLVSIYYNDDAILNERVSCLFSSGYFIIDSIDCATRGDMVYLAHGVFCFLFGYANYNVPILRMMRMNSKATFCEFSNPFMHLAKKTRDPFHFLLFAIVFTLCRIVWLPILYFQCIESGHMTYTSPWLMLLVAFYGLNWMWYVKILKILYDGLFGNKKKSLKDEKVE